jgi:hypothetical protein
LAVIVHVGLHKTGSTWLQQEVFPFLDGVRYTGGVSRRWLSGIVAGEPVEPTFEVPTEGTVLWSSEVLAGPLWDPVEPEVAADRVAAAFPGATILLFTRDPEEWRASVYGQYVNEGGFLSPARFWASVPVATTGTDQERVIAAFRARFPEVHVFAYEDIRADPDAVAGRVAAICGARLTTPPPGRLHNRSLSRPSRTVLRGWNRLFRRSRFNASPLVAVPRARDFRKVLQRYVDPLVPDRWR